MLNKRFVELVGNSTLSIHDALENALQSTHKKNAYRILEARSQSKKGFRQYQVTIKVSQSKQEAHGL